MPRGRLLRLGAVALGAALAALALPRLGLWPLGWFGLAPLFLEASTCARRRDAGLAGFAAGFAYHAVVLHWIYQTCLFARIPSPVAALVWAALSSFLALNWALTAFLGRWLCSRSSRPLRPWIWAVVWTAVAAAAEHWTPRLAVDLLAYTQASNLALLQAGSWGGPHLLGFILVLFNASLAEAWIDAPTGKPGPAVGPLSAAILLAAGVWAHGAAVLLGRSPETSEPGRIEILQPKVEQYHKWDQAYVSEILDGYQRLQEGSRPKPPLLVVWPETSIPRATPIDEAVPEAARWAKSLGSTHLVGVLARSEAGAVNGVQLVTQDGRVGGFYAKRELVPFGEYVPFRNLIPRFVLENWLAVLDQLGDLSAGEPDQPLLSTPFGPTAVTICYEAMFPRWARRDAARGARLLVNVTNDGWYKDTWGPYQHFGANIFRAIENRIPVVRSGNTGISAVIDPYGVVTAKLDLNVRGRLDGQSSLVDPFPRRSFYARHGDWLGLSCLTLLAGAFLLKVFAARLRLRVAVPLPAPLARRTRRKPRVVFSPKYEVGYGDHSFATKKFSLVARGLSSSCTFVEPPEPSRAELLLAHDAAWIDKVVSAKMSPDDIERLEIPFSPEISRAHLLAVGGTLLAARDALEYGVGLHCGGGSHHAFRDHGEGYCALNDLAVAILKLRVEGHIMRAAVVDLDAHQGNGTASIFATDAETFTFSMHQEDIYPGKKEKSTLDIGLEAGTLDNEYLDKLWQGLAAAMEFKPDLVVYQAGVDVWEKDALAGLKLTERGILKRDRAVYEACRLRRVPVVVTLGGGYGPTAEDTARLHLRTLSLFAGT